MNDSLAALASQLVAAEAAGEASTPAWVFGLAALGILIGLLIVTLMIRVDR